MEKLIQRLMANSAVFLFLNLLLYLFYGVLIGVALFPSLCFVRFTYGLRPFSSAVGNLFLLALSLGVAVYLFFLMGLLVFGTAERLLSIGFKPGKYRTDSPFFIRWLVYSGVHTICLSLVLPYVLGSGFTGLYYRLVGCKLGKNVFINTVGLHDSYLLEVGDNVVVGGRSDICCHIFEGDYLILGRVKIGSNTLIGANCYIMPGVEIGDCCDIGANSLIRKSKEIPSGTMLMPVPSLPARQTAGLIRLSRERKKAGIKYSDRT